MEGVQILNQFEVVTKSVFSWDYFWAGIGLGALLGIFIAILIGAAEGNWQAFFFALAIAVPLFSLFLGFLSGGTFEEPVEYETHYEVTITEETSMQEFMDKYEILETRGEIYVVREKD